MTAPHRDEPGGLHAAAPRRAQRGSGPARLACTSPWLLGGLAMMIPFLWMLTTSLKTRAEVFSSAPFSFPTGLHWENYTRMWFALPDVTFGTFFQNSIVIASLATIGQLITCSMAGFAFAVLDFRFKRILFALILATLIIPFQVVLVPNFILYRYLPLPFSESGNWIGTNLPLWVWAFFGGAFGTFLLRQFFLTIPTRAGRRGSCRRGQPVADLPARSTSRSPGRPWRPWRSSSSCGAGTTSSTR